MTWRAVARFLGAAMLAFVLMEALTGCGGSESESAVVENGAPDGEFDDIHVFNVRVRDGQAECIVWAGYEAGGMDCDWPGEGQ